MNNFFSPAEICENMVNGCNNKAKLPISKMLVLGIFAGVFIGFGAYGFTVITSGAGTGFEATFAKYIGAGVFPVGLMLVVICGAELFTGNNLMTLSLFKKEITVGAMLRNWGVVWAANLVGSVLLAYLMSQSGLYGEAMTAKAIGIAEAKCAIPLMPVIIRAIFCNMLVCLAVWMQSGAKDIIGKIFAIWFPIMLFVLSGFEHSVANMFFIPMGIFCGADVTWAQAFLNNILPVTLGNIIGGAVIIPACYHFTYAKKSAA
ncbi:MULTISPECIES: formate/nitrite transporter family protein [Acetobacterium]|uniref:Putative formate transporter 1 n=1 Tax=Acetobacterium wieringae TaxID=52694 RepID=A0A1F2PK34_9FIRM|nr:MULTISPECIES: formate/nitrite transporter family protein [Acetobacterium]OFV71375.1 putative formate transporter 1 [Acetobacterium wieringae]